MIASSISALNGFLRAAVPDVSAAVVAAAFVLTTAYAGEQMRIHLDAGLLTLEADSVPLAVVVGAIGERAGFETILVGDLHTPVTASFAKMPVWTALEKLLGDTNRIVVYNEAERTEDRVVVRLWLLASSDAVRDPVVIAPEQEAFDADLQHSDAKTRSIAVLKLVNAGATDEVLEALAQALRGDEDPLVRTRAANALAKLGDERAVPVLESALLDEHGTVRTAVIHALGQIGGESATTALGEMLLQSTDTRERVVATWGLVSQNTDTAKRYLDAVANDPDKQVRAAANRPSGRAKSHAVEIPTQGEQWGAESVK